MQDIHNIHYLTPELESLLRPTYGVIVYQEQVMQIVQKLAGYSLARADVVRKAMGDVCLVTRSLWKHSDIAQG